jgi:structural maintenance of chromosome 3 (chondroitin sulfate proteoglycan 6)
MLQEDAMRQLESLEREIKDSMVELDKIHPFYEEQVKQEKEITKGYACGP